MALSKIELKLGKKVITLTPAQFEELKQDMRNLDKDHHYYWHNYNWPYRYYNQLITSASGVNYTNSAPSTVNTGSIKTIPTTAIQDPPAFSGSILCAS